MIYHVVNSQESLDEFIEATIKRFEKDRYTVYEYYSGKDRTIPQNKLQHLLYKFVGDHLGNSEKEQKVLCKANIGVPILCRDNPEFKQIYDTVIRPHDYGTKLKMIELLPVTSLFSREQAKEYITEMFRVYSLEGVNWSELIVTQVKNLR